MKKIIALILATVSINAAMAQLPPIIQRPHRQTIMPGVMRELNLTPGQRTEIKGIRQRARERQQALRNSYAPPAVKRSEAKQIRSRARQEIIQVLTPAQRERLQAIRARTRAQRRGFGI